MRNLFVKKSGVGCNCNKPSTMKQLRTFLVFALERKISAEKEHLELIANAKTLPERFLKMRALSIKHKIELMEINNEIRENNYTKSLGKRRSFLIGEIERINDDMDYFEGEKKYLKDNISRQIAFILEIDKDVAETEKEIAESQRP